jgi:hypothetical protein
LKVFWSWQSDHPGKISRHFVKSCLQNALKELQTEPDIEEPIRSAEVDSDRQGVPGSPGLAETIFAKIRATSVFVADVTPVGKVIGSEKRLMNANVAIELGYAMAALKDTNLLMVLNETYGTRDSLPFDLKYKIGPIIYSLAPSANKGEIAAAARDLTGDLKLALRLMLREEIEKSRSELFKEIEPSAGSPARFFNLDELSALVGETDHYLFSQAMLYLRVIPTRSMEPLLRSEAYDLLQGGMTALYQQGITSRRSRNRLGAISFETDAHKKVLQGIQIFLNRELWAFDTMLLRKKDRVPPLGIPTLSVEQAIARAVYAYLEFSVKKLGFSLPIDIEVGAHPIENYVFNMPNNFFDDVWGPIHEDHVRWRGRVTSLEKVDVDDMLLKIFETFFEAAGRKRPPNLYGFPNKVPGTLPA